MEPRIGICQVKILDLEYWHEDIIIFSGFMSTHIDMSPNFAGTLLGITNGFGNIMGFLAPAVTGYIINANQDLAHWRTVFFIGRSNLLKILIIS